MPLDNKAINENGEIMKMNLFTDRITKIVIIVILSFCGLYGCLGSGQVLYGPGNYEGAANGYRGKIRVLVTVSQDGIEDIAIQENSEDAYAAEAMEELKALVLETGEIDPDTVSGATVTSEAFLKALEDALSYSIKQP